MRRIQLAHWLFRLGRGWPGDRRGAVAIMFALGLIPLIVVVALAVDYSFYIEARAQLNLAADAAAMHAVRAASAAYSNNIAATIAEGEAAGQQAGQQWFAAQVGTIGTASVPTNNVVVNVTYAQSPPGFTATVSYSGTVATHLGAFIVPSWNIAGSSTSIVSNLYLEVVMLLDNSSSMLIGATQSDILALENATPCSKQSTGQGQTMSIAYSWNYQKGFGYGANLQVPPTSSMNGQCDPAYDGDPSSCFYVPQNTRIQNFNAQKGLCTNGGGAPAPQNAAADPQFTPQAPCALACHNDANNNDYYGLARSLTPKVTLRLDVVHQAAANVIQSMLNEEEAPGQYSVGIYEFNSQLQQQYPPANTSEASTDLATALSTVNALNPPLTPNVPQTYFAATATQLASTLTPAGDGNSPGAPLKKLFIVTDGVEDENTSPRVIAPFNSQICQKFKDLGFVVYVLYTPYLPVPNPFYLSGVPGGVKAYTEPLENSLVTQTLQACASAPADFFQASDPADINSAMQQMLAAALNQPARVSK